jgi:hypothetical protein
MAFCRPIPKSCLETGDKASGSDSRSWWPRYFGGIATCRRSYRNVVSGSRRPPTKDCISLTDSAILSVLFFWPLSALA